MFLFHSRDRSFLVVFDPRLTPRTPSHSLFICPGALPSPLQAAVQAFQASQAALEAAAAEDSGGGDDDARGGDGGEAGDGGSDARGGGGGEEDGQERARPSKLMRRQRQRERERQRGRQREREQFRR